MVSGESNLPVLPAPALIAPDVDQCSEAQLSLQYLDILGFACGVLTASAVV